MKVFSLTCCTLCRVLEASIAENKASLKRTHTEVWSDSPNPHDRKRMENCPVGLKNVGNTCWFSAVIQVETQHKHTPHTTQSILCQCNSLDI